MPALHNPKKSEKIHVAHPSLGKGNWTPEAFEKAKAGQLNVVDLAEYINHTKGLSLTKVVNVLNGIRCGGYQLKLSCNVALNEISVEVWEKTIRARPIATGYVDRGNTIADKRGAADELRGLAIAYFRLPEFICRYCGKPTHVDPIDQLDLAESCVHEYGNH